VVLTLICYSLPFCYLGRNGVPVLALTNRLSSNPTRRIVKLRKWWSMSCKKAA